MSDTPLPHGPVVSNNCSTCHIIINSHILPKLVSQFLSCALDQTSHGLNLRSSSGSEAVQTLNHIQKSTRFEINIRHGFTQNLQYPWYCRYIPHHNKCSVLWNPWQLVTILLPMTLWNQRQHQCASHEGTGTYSRHWRMRQPAQLVVVDAHIDSWWWCFHRHCHLWWSRELWQPTWDVPGFVHTRPHSLVPSCTPSCLIALIGMVLPLLMHASTCLNPPMCIHHGCCVHCCLCYLLLGCTYL
jgi:hypothetical protein